MATESVGNEYYRIKVLSYVNVNVKLMLIVIMAV
jgi:hypothetical protein